MAFAPRRQGPPSSADGVRHRYTHGYGQAVLSSHAHRTAENSAGRLLPELRAGMDLLDVGCGVGTITVGLAQRVAPGRVEAIDVSEQVVDATARLARDRGLAGTVHARVADVMDLPYADASFDVVHAHQVLQHLADPVEALVQMRRVLRPGGLLAVRDADYDAMRWYPDSPGLERWRTVYTDIARANGGTPDAGRRLLAWSRSAGFTDVTAGASTWCYADPESRAWWSGTWAERTGTVDVPGLGRDALSRGAATAAELAWMAASWRRWGSDPDGWFVVVHGEVLARKETSAGQEA